MLEYSDEQIREHAYRLWEQAGRPDKDPADFWHQAKSELEADVPGNEEPSPLPE